MRSLGYVWHVVIYHIDENETISYYFNHAHTMPGSWGNAIFFKERALFARAAQWCEAVLRPTLHEIADRALRPSDAVKREFPRLPVIRNLGGCGSTILARVIAALPEVVLLSETNPRSSALYNGYMNPIVQVRNWLPELASSISTFDEHELGYPPRFGELLECLHSEAEKLGLNLVIRDFNYVDFIGIPFVWPVPNDSSLDLAVAGRFCLSAIVVVRHPADQLASLRSHRAMQGNLNAEHYLNSYFAFLRAMKGAPSFRYEDIVTRTRSLFSANLFSSRSSMGFECARKICLHQGGGVPGRHHY